MNTDLSSGRDGGWVEVITGVQCRRRCTPEESLALVKQTREPGMTVSLVARMAGIAATQLFQWKKAYSEGSLVAVGDNEPVVPASEMVEALKRIKQRDQLDNRHIYAIMNSQYSREARKRYADDIIVNNGDIPSLSQQVAEKHCFYMHALVNA